MSFPQVKSYFLVPNLNIPAPPDSPMALGRVLDNKLNPLRCLNIYDAIPPETVYEDLKSDWCHEAEHQSNERHSVWGRFIYSLYGFCFGGDAGTYFNSSILSNYVFSTLETTFFEPDEQYISKTMWAPSLVNFLEASRFKKPVYIITGLKVARGVRATSRKSTGSERSTAANAAPVMCIDSSRPFGAGRHVEGNSRQVEADCFAGSTDIVIGYRLRKVTCGKDVIFEHEEETGGTLLSHKEAAPEVWPPFQVKTIGTGDAVPDETDSMETVQAIDDVGEEDCRCFVLSK